MDPITQQYWIREVQKMMKADRVRRRRVKINPENEMKLIAESLVQEESVYPHLGKNINILA